MPAVTDLLDIIETRLGNISTINEYYTMPKMIARAKLTPFNDYDLPAINFWLTRLNVVSRQYQKQSRELSLFVEIHNSTRDRPFVDVVSELASDIVISLNRHPDNPKISDVPSLDLGGVVTGLDFQGYDYLIGEGQSPWCGALCQFTIKYQSDIDDMENYTS